MPEQLWSTGRTAAKKRSSSKEAFLKLLIFFIKIYLSKNVTLSYESKSETESEARGPKVGSLFDFESSNMTTFQKNPKLMFYCILIDNSFWKFLKKILRRLGAGKS